MHCLISDILILPIQDINSPCIITDNVQGFEDGENTDYETVFVLVDFDSPEYSYLYKRENRIIGPPVVLHCAAKEEVSQWFKIFIYFFLKKKNYYLSFQYLKNIDSPVSK